MKWIQVTWIQSCDPSITFLITLFFIYFIEDSITIFFCISYSVCSWMLFFFFYIYKPFNRKIKLPVAHVQFENNSHCASVRGRLKQYIQCTVTKSTKRRKVHFRLAWSWLASTRLWLVLQTSHTCLKSPSSHTFCTIYYYYPTSIRYECITIILLQYESWYSHEQLCAYSKHGLYTMSLRSVHLFLIINLLNKLSLIKYWK